MSALERLHQAVPQFVSLDPVMQMTYDAIAPELDLVLSTAETTPEQAWPHLVSWGISRLEEIYKINHAPNASLEQRRSVLLAKMRSAPVSTLARIRNVAQSHGGQSVEITEQPSLHQITISIEMEPGKSVYIPALMASVRAAAPAHISFTIDFMSLEDVKLFAETAHFKINYPMAGPGMLTGTLPQENLVGALRTGDVLATPDENGTAFLYPACSNTLLVLEEL